MTMHNDKTHGGLPLFARSQSNPIPATPLKVLRLLEVIDRVGLKRASIYQRISEGHFPQPIPLGSRAVGWLEHEINDWLRQRLEERKTTTKSSADITHTKKDEM